MLQAFERERTSELEAAAAAAEDLALAEQELRDIACDTSGGRGGAEAGAPLVLAAVAALRAGLYARMAAAERTLGCGSDGGGTGGDTLLFGSPRLNATSPGLDVAGRAGRSSGGADGGELAVRSSAQWRACIVALRDVEQRERLQACVLDARVCAHGGDGGLCACGSVRDGRCGAHAASAAMLRALAARGLAQLSGAPFERVQAWRAAASTWRGAVGPAHPAAAAARARLVLALAAAGAAGAAAQEEADLNADVAAAEGISAAVVSASATPRCEGCGSASSGRGSGAAPVLAPPIRSVLLQARLMASIGDGRDIALGSAPLWDCIDGNERREDIAGDERLEDIDGDERLEEIDDGGCDSAAVAGACLLQV
eukprot:363465-Chlamydomonas_euryale.AAC.4